MIKSINRGSIAQTGILPNGMNFLCDTYPLQVLETKSVVSEGVAGGRPAMRITGIFQKADEKNANGRVYPRAILAEAVKEIQEDISKRAIIGEFDHPSDAKIHLDRISHVITKLWMEGKTVYGTAEIIEDMPCGSMLAALFKNKIQVGISSRGVGDMETVQEGHEEVQKVTKGYSIVTFDVVAEPSVTSAVLSVMESRDRRILTRKARAAIDPQAELVRQVNLWLKGQ